jgi:protein O-GlcNAc transferase
VSTIDEQVRAAALTAQSGRLDLAIPVIEEALKLDPGHAEGNRVMALAMLHTGNPQLALGHISQALRTSPARADLHATLGSMLFSFGQPERSIESLRQALALDPKLAPTHGLLATILLQKKDYEGAEDHYRQAIAIEPRFAEARTNLGSLMGMLARQDEAIAILRDGARDHPNHAGLLINYAVALNYAHGIDPAEVRAVHHHYGRVLMGLPGQVQTQWPNSRDPDRCLRIGLVSPDFFEHSVAYFARPIVEGLDRRQFLVHLYSTGGRPDNMTRRLQQAADVWRDHSRSTDAQLLEALRADQIDVLVELSGLTLGNRMAALRLRGAPVQVTYCGYPNTTGVPSIDYRIVDSLTDPLNGIGAEAMAVEKLVRLDPCFLCYSPPDDVPSAVVHAGWLDPPAAPSRDFITFGSFNSIKKVTPHLLSVWARLLHEVPRARLVIKSQGLETPRARGPILNAFRQQGIPEFRVDLWERIQHKGDHLSAYAAIDIALDAFPYNGTTTTCESMWMGVPVVTLVGDLHASRVGLSLLSAIGLGELAAATEDDYIRVAATLANDPPRLASLKQDLRHRMSTSVLCDRAGFAAKFGGALRSMWHTYCRA